MQDSLLQMLHGFNGAAAVVDEDMIDNVVMVVW